MARTAWTSSSSRLSPRWPKSRSASARVQNVKLGAQNMHWEKSGAFTGEISGAQLRELFVRYIVLGHSERRSYFGETDEIVNKKVGAALEASLKPIVCIGETLAERDSGRSTKPSWSASSAAASPDFPAKDLAEIVVAYEPVWAIGTGRTATPEQAQDAHAFIRKTAAAQWDQAVGRQGAHPVRRQREAGEHRGAHGAAGHRRRLRRGREPRSARLCGDRQKHRRAPALTVNVSSRPRAAGRTRRGAAARSGASPSAASFLTIALPTTTASAHCATARTCSGVEMPKPTAIGSEVVARISATRLAMLSARSLRSPVTPSRET